MLEWFMRMEGRKPREPLPTASAVLKGIIIIIIIIISVAEAAAAAATSYVHREMLQQLGEDGGSWSCVQL